MSLFDRLRPKWNHSDPAVREQAVRELDDQAVLEKIAHEDSCEAVRLAAVERLKVQDVLGSIARGSTALAVPAMKRLTDRSEVVRTANIAEQSIVREMAVERIDDGATLHRIAASDPDARVRLKARTRSPFPDPTRDFIRRRLSKLRPAPRPPDVPAEFSGKLEEVCAALIGDTRFKINGGIEHHDPAAATPHDQTKAPFGSSADDSVAAPELSTQFLAFKRGERGEPARTGVGAFFQIRVWRTDRDVYEYCAFEKRVDVSPDTAKWSQISSGTAAGELPPEGGTAGG